MCDHINNYSLVQWSQTVWVATTLACLTITEVWQPSDLTRGLEDMGKFCFGGL